MLSAAVPTRVPSGSYHRTMAERPEPLHPHAAEPPPKSLHLDRARGLEIEWADGTRDVLPIDHLRRHSPSADARELRAEIARNPLAVLPSGGGDGPLRATGAELVGNYAVRITFSDGHSTGIYSWGHLRRIAPGGGGPAADA